MCSNLVNSKSSGLEFVFRILSSSNHREVYIKVFDTNIEENGTHFRAYIPEIFYHDKTRV